VCVRVCVREPRRLINVRFHNESANPKNREGLLNECDDTPRMISFFLSVYVFMIHVTLFVYANFVLIHYYCCYRRNGNKRIARAAAGDSGGADGNVKFANNKAEWESVTGDNKGLIAVQISTKTCGPCKVIYPTFVGLSEEFAGKATFVKIMGDTDTESRALMKEWGVRVVPLFMLWKNGEKIAEWSGAKPDVLRENVTSAM
jgi:thioredoxin 1